jgi:hypothetical protein
MTAPSLAAKGCDDMQEQRHLRTHAGEAGTKEGAVSNKMGPVVQIRAPDGRIRRRRDERVAVDHHRHNREWTRVAAARVSEMPEPPHLVQWH